MGQLTLYKNEDPSSNKAYPYFIDVQNSLLDGLNSRLVVPLAPHQALKNTAAKRLSPIIPLQEGNFVLLTHQLTSVPKSMLKTEVASLEKFRYDILAAIDMLISGI